METLLKTLESKSRIQYQDCDPFNHLNNSKYIDYMIGARTEQLLDQYGLNISELAYKYKIGWVTGQTQISYLYPALWMEAVTIETKLIQYSDHSLLIDALMWDENKTKLKAIMWVKLIHFDIKTQKSIKHSDDLIKLFSEIHYPLEYTTSFDERVKSLKQIN